MNKICIYPYLHVRSIQENDGLFKSLLHKKELRFPVKFPEHQKRLLVWTMRVMELSELDYSLLISITGIGSILRALTVASFSKNYLFVSFLVEDFALDILSSPPLA